MFTSDTLADKVGAVPIEKSRPLPIVNNLLPAHTIPAAAKREPRYAANEAAEIDQSERRTPSGRTDSYLTKTGPQHISYYNLKRHWTKNIEPHLYDTELNDILTKDFNKFTWGRWRIGFGENELPHEFETFFGFFQPRGPLARFRWYTKHGACHWLVNFALRLAMLAIPSQTWRIITSDAHSTVWNGKNLLFDFNYFAIGEPARECFEAANELELSPGEYLDVGFAEDRTVHRPTPAPSD